MFGVSLPSATEEACDADELKVAVVTSVKDVYRRQA
jgi:hypothetical protein